MCIYLKGQQGLNHNSQEHIIMAALGGKTKLPAEYVSQEFNNSISKLEQEFARDSLIAIPRLAEGPGKRGSLAEAKAAKSKVHLVQNVNDSSLFALGFSKLSKVYEIPHVIVDQNEGRVTFSCSSELWDTTDLVLANFMSFCNDWNGRRQRVLMEEKLPLNSVLFGIEKGVEENFHFFIAKNPANTFEPDENWVKIIGRSLAQLGKPHERTKYMPRATMKAVFREDHLRIFAKMAFNLFAHIKGEEFVLADHFDPIRNWVVNGGENFFVALNQDKPMADVFPASAHVILMTKVENSLVATVHLYGGFGVIIRLSENFHASFPLNGIVCDWKNRKEYMLKDYWAVKIGNDGE